MKRFQNYIELDVWNEARKLANLIYKISNLFPKEEGAVLIQLMRKSAISIPAGIAEATSMYQTDDTLDILFHTRRGLYELESMAYLSMDQMYITTNDLNELIEQLTACKRLINGFINYYRKSKNPSSRPPRRDFGDESKAEDNELIE